MSTSKKLTDKQKVLSVFPTAETVRLLGSGCWYVRTMMFSLDNSQHKSANRAWSAAWANIKQAAGLK